MVDSQKKINALEFLGEGSLYKQEINPALRRLFLIFCDLSEESVLDNNSKTIGNLKQRSA